MPIQPITAIIKTCLQLEGMAIKVYGAFAEQAKAPMKLTWQHMQDQEKEHAQYWRALLALAEKGQIQNVFDDPGQILKELKREKGSAEKYLADAESFFDDKQRVLLAYRLEFIMLHPAFEAMFYLMRDLTGDRSPSDDYLDHVNQLIEILNQIGQSTPEFELMAELTARLWKQNHQIAEQLAHIREIRGLVPICMHCKNIRDDEGFWTKVETYISDRSHAEFSHGVCPDCLRKYYSDVLSDEDIDDVIHGE